MAVKKASTKKKATTKKTPKKGVGRGVGGGRPTTYRPIFCKKAKELFAQGMTTKVVCAHIGVSPGIFYQWVKKYPKFKNSIDEGRALGEQWFLEQAKRMVIGERGNYQALAFLMKNLYRYKDNPEDNSDDKPINITFTIKEPEEE